MTRSVLVDSFRPVTGGTGALGVAVTRRFLEAGHRVVVTSRTSRPRRTSLMIEVLASAKAGELRVAWLPAHDRA